MSAAPAPRASSLRARFFRALVIASAFPLGLLFLVEITLFTRYESMAARERMAAVAARIARDTASYVHEHRRAVESLAHLLATHPMDPAEAESALNRFHERYPGFLTMRLATRDGVVTAASRAADAQGVRHGAQGGNVADREYFRQAMTSGRPFISPAFQDRGFGTDAIVAISAPVGVGAAADSRAAIVEGSLDLRRLRDVILPMGGPPGTEAVVADAEGTVVFSSMPGIEPLARRPPEGTGALVVDTPVDDLGWTVTTRVSSRAVHAQRNRFLAATAAAAFLALATGFLLARRQARAITGPLRELVRSLHSFDAGRELEPPRPARAPAEVLELFESFAGLAGRLKVAHDELRNVLAGLEQQVRERTETLRESEERFRQLADNIDVVFWVLSLEPRRMLYVSPAYEDIWERPRSELHQDQMAFAESIHPDDRERVLAAIAAHPLGPYAQEYRIVGRSGLVKWIRSIGFPVHDARGRVIRIAGLSENVTEAHRLDQLRQDLTHTMVHDLRAPLTGVQAGIDVALQPDVSPLLRKEGLEVALRSVRKLLFLIDASLDGSRLESGRFPIEMSFGDLSAVVTEVVASFEALACAGGISLQVEAGIASPARFDEALLRRVIENLVGNAVKFTPAGGTVRVAVARDDGGLRVSVSDDGPGIEPELASRLFEKFVTGRRPGRGSGLGLAFCRLAVEAHGGSIRLDGAAGPGATFVVTLPLLEPA
ncbi:MAG TPA: ATP-binding protein [Vicinamibacteria bacterium]|nr:ATP-binding protein [Vicinamibacteria bacterium]